MLQDEGLLMHAVKFASRATVTVLFLHLLGSNLGRAEQSGSGVRTKTFKSGYEAERCLVLWL